MDNLRLAPLVALVALAGVAPFLSALRNSFYLGDAFAGMANYRQLLADRGFPMAAAITIGWSLLSATTTLAIAYPLASLAMASRRACAILFPLFVAMWAVPVYIGAPLWRFVLHGAAGDSVFRTLTGIEVNLMNSPSAAFLSTAMVASWFRLPQAVLILIAALGRSRQSIDDAARADGAGYCGSCLHHTPARHVWSHSRHSRPGAGIGLQGIYRAFPHDSRGPCPAFRHNKQDGCRCYDDT
ncbi:hypothetical protein MASR2M48_23100 [Spirochaetota bacterium]